MSEKIQKKLRSESEEYRLNDFEYAFLTELEVLLQFHTNKKEIVDRFITYIIITRLGYASIREGYRLKYKIDIRDEQAWVIISEVKA